MSFRYAERLRSYQKHAPVRFRPDCHITKRYLPAGRVPPFPQSTNISPLQRKKKGHVHPPHGIHGLQWLGSKEALLLPLPTQEPQEDDRSHGNEEKGQLVVYS